MGESRISLDWIKWLDFMSPEVKLNMGGRKGLKTFVGAAIGMVYIGIMVTAIIYALRIYFKTDNPNLMNETIQMAKYPSIDLVDNKIVPVVVAYYGLYKSLTTAEMARYFSIETVHQLWNVTAQEGSVNNGLVETIIPSVPCGQLSPEDRRVFDYLGKGSFLSSMLDEFAICTQPERSLMRVSGRTDDEIQEMVILRIKPCRLDPSECAPLEELSQISYYIVVPEVGFEQTNFHQPFVFTPNIDKLYYIVPETAQYVTSMVKSGVILDYIGFLPSWQERARYNDLKETFNTISRRYPASIQCPQTVNDEYEDCPAYLEFTLMSSGTQLKIKRRFKTIMETFGEIGGYSLCCSLSSLYSMDIITGGPHRD